MNLAQPDQSTQGGEYLVSYLYITSVSSTIDNRDVISIIYDSTPSHMIFIFRSGVEGLRLDYYLTCNASWNVIGSHDFIIMMSLYKTSGCSVKLGLCDNIHMLGNYSAEVLTMVFCPICCLMRLQKFFSWGM